MASEEFEDEGVALPLLDLPEELLLRVLTGTGSKALINSAACCQRLKSAKEALAQHTCFASAASQLPQLEDALRDAAARAMEGMLGCVTFALLFTANYPHPKKYRDPSDVSNAADLLAKYLPKGTPIVGCAMSGILGTGADGRAFEIDPQQRNSKGVTLLLGHMPRAVVRVFADTAGSSQSTARSLGRGTATVAASFPAWAPVEQWVGLQRDGLTPVSAWLMVQSTRSATACMTGPDGVVEWIQSQAAPGCPPAVAGGIASGQGADLLFHPGRQEDDAGVQGWDPLAGVQKARYVGLMVCTKSGDLPTSPSSSKRHHPPPSDPCSPSSSSAAALRTSASGPGPRPALYGGPCAAVMSMRGAGRQAGSSWWGGLKLDHVKLEDEDCHLINLSGASSFFRLGSSAPSSGPGSTASAPILDTGGPSSSLSPPHGGHAPVLQAPPYGAGSTGSPLHPSHGSGPGSPHRSTRSRSARAAAAAAPPPAPPPPPADFPSEYELLRGPADAEGQAPLLLALWRTDATPDCMSTGLCPDVMDSGLCVVAGLGRCPFSGAFRVVVDDEDDAALQSVLELGAQRVCCQLASVSPEAIRQLLGRELLIARDICRPQPQDGSCVADPRSWDGYALLRRSAQAVGARAGPVALAVFTCTGRGRSIFVNGDEGEAAITDEVLGGDMPFVGAFCNGEIGPHVRQGYAGWSVAGEGLRLDPAAAGVSSPRQTPAGPGASGARNGGSDMEGGAGASEAGEQHGEWGRGEGVDGLPLKVPAVARGGRRLQRDACLMQGWTSMYSMLS